MEEQQPKKFTHKEMQRHLPDYAFGRITEKDKQIFERTLPDFEDIQQELQQVNSVFSKVEKMDFDTILQKKTRNLSVNVQNRLNKKQVNRRTTSFNPRLLIPVVAVAAFMFLMITTDTGDEVGRFLSGEKKTAGTVEYQLIKFRPGETIALMDDSVDLNALNLASNELAYSRESEMEIIGASELNEYVQEEINSLYDEFLYEKFFDFAKTDIERLVSSGILPDYLSEDDFENINEEEFQKLIEGLENEDFTS